ncbi:MAG TPA: hypothetical protein VMU55_06160, partial [Solirubrobacteraceae bacterium]|nr:hypothetical protein [Solirubrobacteraceae bacterium]
LAFYLESAASSWQLPTLRLAVSAIQHLHRQHGCALDPTIARGLRGTLAGLIRKPVHPPAALDLATLVGLLDAMPATLLGKRNRAILLLGFAAALRPGEIVGLDLVVPAPGGTGLITFTRDGIEILLRRSKTDPQQSGIRKLIPNGCTPCPVTALRDWLKAAGIAAGVVFPSSRPLRGASPARLTRNGLLEVVRQAADLAARKAGLPLERSNRARTFTGRSLRSGFVTSAIRANLCPASITIHVGWTSPRMAVNYSRSLGGDRELIGHILDWHRPHAN